MNVQVHVIATPPAVKTKRVASAHGYTYVLFYNNQAVGMAVVNKEDPDRFLIDSISVDFGMRGGQLGSTLLQRIVDDADRAGAKLELFAVDADDPALLRRKIAWYRRFGFIDHPTFKDKLYTDIGLWMIRYPRKRHVRAPPLAPAPKVLSDAEIKHLVKRVKRDFVFTGLQNVYSPLEDAKLYERVANPFEDLDPWQQRYLISQAMDPNIEAARTPEEANEQVAAYTYTFQKIPLGEFPVSYWEKAAGDLVARVEHDLIDDETRYLAVQVQRIYDLQHLIDRDGFDTKQPIVVAGFAHDDEKFGIDNGHHRIQALRNLVRLGKIKPNVKVPVVIRFSKDIHEYGRINYRGLTDVHHNLGRVLADAHWPQTVVTVPFTFGKRHGERKTLYTYMLRISPDRVLFETAMPMRDAKMALVRVAVAYIRHLKPGIQVVSKRRYPGDITFLRKLEKEGVFYCILGETCMEGEA